MGAHGRATCLVVDGERIEGNLVPTQPAGSVVDVVAELAGRTVPIGS